MPLALRTVRGPRWDRQAVLRQQWLPHGEIGADLLGDLNTNDNAISIWHIEDDRSNLNRVLVALAATKEHLSNVDFLLFDQTILDRLNLCVEQSSGETADETVNGQWHQDVRQLSASRLVALAAQMLINGELHRVQKKRLTELLGDAIRAGHIDKARLNDSMRHKANEMLGVA